MTMIVVTHEMGFARDVSTEVVFMHKGKIAEIGPPEEMFGAPRAEEFRSFIADVAESHALLAAAAGLL